MRAGNVMPLLLVAGGCNQLYGLDKTRTVDAVVVIDRDSDGVLDEQDNCPDVANTGQDNLDADAQGDACDACSYVFGPALDRDGDGIAASADNCPAADNAEQDDADADGIGDVCDPNPGVSDTVRCFDDFSMDAPLVWPITDPWQWLGTANSAMIFHNPATAPPFSIAARVSSLPPVRGAVQVELLSPSTTVDATSGVGVGARDLSAGARCEIVGTGGLALRLSDAGGVLKEQALSFSGQRMLATLGYQIGAATVLDCTASTANGMRLTIRATSNTAIELATVGLFSTNTNAVFRGLAIYDTAP